MNKIKVLEGESYVDHGLTREQLAYALAHAGAKPGVLTIATVELPVELGQVPCELHGPCMGDDALVATDVFYGHRGQRPYESRLCDRGLRMQRKVSVIAGPAGTEPCVLYTAYGGPVAPREPGDPTLPAGEETEKSQMFWAEHALAMSNA